MPINTNRAISKLSAACSCLATLALTSAAWSDPAVPAPRAVAGHPPLDAAAASPAPLAKQPSQAAPAPSQQAVPETTQPAATPAQSATTAAQPTNVAMQDAVTSAQGSGEPVVTPQPTTIPPTQPSPVADAGVRDSTAHEFSFGRYIANSLAGGLAGGLAAYGIYAGLCGDEPCLEGRLLAGPVHTVVSSGTISLLGDALGGEGDFLDAAWGSSVVVLIGVSADANAAITYSIAPFVDALTYELGSHRKGSTFTGSASSPKATTNAVHASVTPWVSPDGTAAGFSAAGTF